MTRQTIRGGGVRTPSPGGVSATRSAGRVSVDHADEPQERGHVPRVLLNQHASAVERDAAAVARAACASEPALGVLESSAAKSKDRTVSGRVRGEVQRRRGGLRGTASDEPIKRRRVFVAHFAFVLRPQR